MKDYNEMSDFEINRLVAIKAGHKSYHEDGSYTNDGSNVTVKGNGILGWFNPCKNPEDIWPIIVKNGICIHVDKAGINSYANTLDSNGYCKNEFYDKNPLRAAAIVYLMIKDEK